ncbi:MAG: lysophospholipid acyltransferase family protein [Deltaproteobacteria bacterium]|nr:lysophospholipid acyltransferase family protein [Deltaproteobacteria bacterium]
MKPGFSAGSFLYWLRYRMGEYLLRGFVWIFPWIPRWLMLGVTKAASRLAFAVLWRYRKRMAENVAAGFGAELPTAQEQKQLVQAAWENFTRGVYETIACVRSPKGVTQDTIAMEGEEHLQRALARGRGVIALSAHLGSFTLIGARLAAAGYPFSVVVKHPRDKGFARLLDHYRAVVGMKTIAAKPRREAARKILKALRNNEVVLMIADEFRSGGVEVEFLGRMVRAPRGPVTLALRSGAAVVPMFMVRGGQDRLTLHIWPEIELAKSGDVPDDVAWNVALFARQLEAMVRRHPDQWNWLGFQRNGRPRRARTGKLRGAEPDRERAPAAEMKQR